ncbi:hypothetical protein VB779_14310 [Haloarculaceae archaeon H-GB11]|nr:hypothetical protein [Haloarculaceae archaeon H-GB11]
MVWTDELADDTVFVSPPPAVTHPLATVVAPLARRFGYRMTYPKYEDPGFGTDTSNNPASEQPGVCAGSADPPFIVQRSGDISAGGRVADFAPVIQQRSEFLSNIDNVDIPEGWIQWVSPSMGLLH